MYTNKLRSGTQKLKTRRSMQTQYSVAGEERDIVIVGGGICGLATALALHRKGIKSVVLERSETLRSTGAAIIMQPNGWRALDQLGVASRLRQTAVPILSGLHIAIESSKLKELPDIGKQELRCLKRADLIQSLADDLPADTIRFKCQVISAKLHPITSFPVLQLHDGTLLKAQVVIGCDGVNSIISASILGLKSTKHFSTCVIRGFTNYEDGHELGNKFVVVSGKDQVQLGRMPITNKLVYWFLTRKWSSRDGMTSKHPELIKRSVTETMTDRHFPKEAVEMTSKSELDSLHVTEQLRYRPPLELLRRRFRKGTVTVAGDAMHAMGPFLAQGGSASLEDAVVLGRCLARNLRTKYSTSSFGGREMRALMVGNAFDEYVKERRMRAFRVSMETYLIGLMLDSSSVIVKFIAIALMCVVFRDPAGHTRYNCGRL